MPRFFVITAFFCCSIFSLAPLQAAAPDGQALDALIAPYDKPDAPGVSLAVMIDGKPVYQRWVGKANIAHDVPINADTRFASASVSKKFTAFAIMSLADEGKLTLDQDIRDFIPELAERSTPITIRDLLNHTGGLREANSLLQLTGAYESSPIPQARSLDLILRQRGSNFPTGQRQEYSNTGYQLLAEIVARVAKQPFPEFMRSRIFVPLNMDQTLIRTDTDQIIPGLATGYKPIKGGFAKALQLSATYGSTGVISTPRDLLRWSHAWETGTVGPPAVIAAMEARSTLANGRRAIGSNGQEYRIFRGRDSWSHGGSTGGFRSFLLRIPKERMSIVVMSNRSDFLKAAFAFAVAEILIPDHPKPEPTVDFIPETGPALDRYVGDYQLFAGIIFSLRRDGDQLTFATFGKDDASPLPQVGKGKFTLNPKAQLQVEFHDFVDGRASEMRWQVSRDGYIPAPRVALQPVPQTPLNIAELEAFYYCEPLQQMVTLYKKEDRLWLRTGDGNSVPLDRYQSDVFRAGGPGSVQRVTVVRGTDGQILKLLISAALADDLEYRKIDKDEISGPE